MLGDKLMNCSFQCFFKPFLGVKMTPKIVNLVYVHCHAHRLASACYYTAADLYSMVHETVKAL